MKKTLFVAMVVGLLLPSFVFGFDRNLKIGMRGDDVSELQNILIDQGCLTSSPTGYFGLLTLRGVRCFQSKNNLPSTGYFGSMSREIANRVISDEASSSVQAEVQETGTTTPLSVCVNGAKFNFKTGQPCQPDNQTLLNTINDLKVQISNLQPVQPVNNLGGTAVPATPEPLILHDVVANLDNPSRVDYSTNGYCVHKVDLPNDQFRYAVTNNNDPQVNAGGFTLTLKDDIKIRDVKFSLNDPENIVSIVEIPQILGKYITGSQDITVPTLDKQYMGSKTDNQYNYNYFYVTLTKPGTFGITLNAIDLSDGRTVKGLPISFNPVTISECK